MEKTFAILTTFKLEYIAEKGGADHKKICNMSIGEAKQAFDKWAGKNCIDDKFEMGGLQLTQYAEFLGKADLKTKIDKRVKDESHRKLLELVYYLSFGYREEYFYCMMSYLLPEDCFYLMPSRIKTPMLAIRTEREDRKSKRSKAGTGTIAEEKKAGEYRCNITRMIYDMESEDILIKIYTCAKTHFAI